MYDRALAILAISIILGAPSTARAERQAAAGFVLEEATIARLQAAFASGALTCRQLAEQYLDRIAAYDDGGPRLNAVTTINPKALDMATALDAERARSGSRGPLHCVPVLLKDNVDTADMPTSNGSVLLKASVPPDDAPLARALRDAGALILGKASMGEFAGGSYNTIDGQAVNPYNVKRGTGGSSSGSGAAIAANFAVLAIGTDTSTSVRGPAAFNGIVGLRPTTGLISRDGIAPKNLQFDTAGPMARTVTDVAQMLNVVAFPDPADPLSETVYAAYPAGGKSTAGGRRRYADFTRHLQTGALKGARLGVVRDFFGGDPEIDALAAKALDTLTTLGAELVDIQLDPAFLEFYVRRGSANIRTPADARFRADWETYLATLAPAVPKTVASFIATYETDVARSAKPVEATVMNLLKRSTTTSTADAAYRDLVDKVLPEATRLKLAIFAQHKVDALVFPYHSTFADPINNPTGRIDDPTFVASTRPSPSIFAGYSSIGFPALVVPMGFGSQGLPMAISFMGRPYDEGRLLGYGFAYEQVSKHRRPSPLVPPLHARQPSSPAVTFVPERFYNTFSSAHPPALRIKSGDRVVTKTIDAGGMDWNGQQVASGGNPQTGPFYVEGAEPGDMLMVTIEKLEVNRGTAYSGSLLGPYTVDPPALLARSDKEPRRVTWLLDKVKGTARLDGSELGRLELPLRPMLGCLAVAPARKEAIATSTPGAFGGNMDYAGLNAGVTVMLPVNEPGALLFLGDGHARQGEGEVVGTGLETSLDVEFSVKLVKQTPIAWPRLENDTHIMVLGSARPLLQALQHATADMQRWLVASYGLSERGAAILMGQALEYEIANVVDPNFTVVAKIRKAWLSDVAGAR